MSINGVEDEHEDADKSVDLFFLCCFEIFRNVFASFAKCPDCDLPIDIKHNIQGKMGF